MTNADQFLDSTSLSVPSPVPKSRATPDGFFADLEAFKVDMKEAGLEGAQEQLATIEVRKPRAEDFVRVNPEREMSLTVALHENRDNFTSEYYVVLPKMLGTMLD